MKILNIDFWLLLVSVVLTILLMIYLLKKEKSYQLRNIFIVDIVLTMIISLGVLCQSLFSIYFNINPMIFENFIYIGTCFLPVAILFTGLIFANTKINFKKKYILLFIVPIVSLLVLWTNDFHHLFYEHYSFNINECIYGKYIIIHHIYSYGIMFIGMIILLKFSIKNSGIFSKQSILTVIGILIPLVINILGSSKIIPMSIYMTPIAFSVTMIFIAFAIFKFNFLKVAPIALQKIVDRISDSYIVINEDNNITDFNKTFVNTFSNGNIVIRNKNLFDLIKKNQALNIDTNTLKKSIEESKNSDKTIILEKHFGKIDKYFRIEINSIKTNGNFLGILILLKDITQHTVDMQTIKENQDMLIERERLASLGQMIGGIAHNLKTPIMSIAGAAEGLTDLIKEYDMSIENSEVTENDHHEIAKDMSSWVDKIKSYTEYMSDVITAVKGQAVTLSDEQQDIFTVEELIKRVNILMRHELKNALVNLNVSNQLYNKIELHGNVNSLVQVINNMISNSIQAYNGRTNENIDLIVTKKDRNVVFTIKDYAGGLPKEVKEKLFKEMITTKGKNGTGLGLFMSYSNIKAHFNGNITFKTENGKGTEFNIIIPM